MVLSCIKPILTFFFEFRMSDKHRKNQEEIIDSLRTRIKLEDYGVLNVIFI